MSFKYSEDAPPSIEYASLYLPPRALPAGTFIVHTTNCMAHWDSGLSAELAKVFPEAYMVYQKKCFERVLEFPFLPSRHRVGSCIIIPPQKEDIAAGAPSVFIVCLFTTHGYGEPEQGRPGRDHPDAIIQQTKSSLMCFRNQLRAYEEDNKIQIVHSELFNSEEEAAGKEPAWKSIETCFAGWRGQWIVLAEPKDV